jgi:hypothetical protein
MPKDPTEEQIAAACRALRAHTTPSKQITRLKKGGSRPTRDKPPAIMIRLHSTEQRETIKARAARHNMTLQAYCLYLFSKDKEDVA